MVRGNIVSSSDAFQEPLVLGSLLNEHTETCIGDSRARIAGQSAQNYLVAVGNQLMAHRLADCLSGSNSMEMLLPLTCDALYQNIVAQSARLSQDRLGNFNCIIKSKRTGCFAWCVIYRGKSLRKLYASGNFNLGNKFM